MHFQTLLHKAGEHQPAHMPCTAGRTRKNRCIIYVALPVLSRTASLCVHLVRRGETVRE